jgi:hypothetical protein
MAVNYQMDVINPFQAALSGYGAGAQILQQERTAERQVRQDEQQGQLFGLQMQEAQARLQTLNDERAKAQRAQASMAKAIEAVQNGEFSSELIAETYAASPEFGKFLQAERDRLSTEQKQNLANQNLEIATAIEMDEIPIAQKLYEEMAVAAENSGKPEDAAAARAMAAQLDTPDGRDVVRTTAYMAAGSVLPSEDFNQRYANIQAMRGAPLKATLAELDVDLRKAQIAREEAATRLDARRAKMEATTGVEVQSSRQLDDGTTVMVMKDGTRRVLDPKGTLVEGEAAQQAIAAANKASIDIQGQRAGARSGATMAQGQAKEAFVTLGNIRSNITNLDKVATLLDKPGVSTGVIESQLPTWDASTIELRNMRSRLGLDVVGAVTFGALSEGELNLALDVALPTNLSPPALKKWVLDKKAAQEKLSNYFSEQVRFLSIPGNTLGDWEQHQINRSRMGAGSGAGAGGGVPDGAEFVRDASGKLVLKQ